ncbi:E3 ubiquitin-protein ligase RZF1 [Balamuthia mandrillaris]
MQQGHGSNGGAATNGGMGVGSPSGGGGGRRLLLFLELRTRAPSPYAASSPSLPFSALSFGPSNNNTSPPTPSQQPPLRQVVVLIDSVPLVPGTSTPTFTGGGGGLGGISLLGGLGGSTTATTFGSNLMAEALASLVSSATATTASDDAEESSFQRLLDRLRELHPPAGPPPASREALDGLPSLRVHAHLKEEAVRCPVCFEDFVVGRRVLALPCRHVFDKECVVPWLKQHNTCPVCRYELPVADPQADRERKARMQAERGVDEAAFFASKGRNLFKKKTTSASTSVAASSSTSPMVLEEKEKKEEKKKTTQRRSRRIAGSTRKAKREEEAAEEEEHEEEKPKKRRASRRQHNKDKGKEKEAHSPSSVNQTTNEADVRHHQKRSKASKTLKRKRSSVEQAENDVLHDTSSAPTKHDEDTPSNNDDSLGFFGRLKRKASKAIAHATGREKQPASSSSSSSSTSSSSSPAPAYNTRSKKSRRTNNE